jgi:hypothetical protein
VLRKVAYSATCTSELPHATHEPTSFFKEWQPATKLCAKINGTADDEQVFRRLLDDRSEEFIMIIIITSLSTTRLGSCWSLIFQDFCSLGFESRQELGIFLFTTVSRPALGPAQPPIQWVPGAPSLGVKWPGREADHSPPSKAEVKNVRIYTSTPTIRLHGAVLSYINHSDNFTFYLYRMT